jgi:hypothetical protein
MARDDTIDQLRMTLRVAPRVQFRLARVAILRNA